MRAKGRQRAAAILDAATALLLEEGHAALSTRKIAARADVRPGHLQYYYPSKHDIVRALLERHLLRAAEAVAAARAVPEGHDPRARLRATITAILADQASSPRSRFFVELWALAARDPTLATTMRAFYASYWRAIAALLLEHDPALGRVRAGRRAAALVALLEGLMVFRSDERSRRLPLDGLEDEVLAIALDIAARPPA